ncbi:TPA: hypothetical protein MFX78_02320 [Klebsiella pneumoniae]|uniref:hypothetical protein n=1 Tax=Klebsiella pneumoniae TaxID=573 RepID=UPI001330C7F9|nr:hypothetical protein [Klebsiella pneumoniae]EIV9538797.1 hypothetical protein [Klebsiella pneumoniae]HBW9906960.1 hypothetical protein [Klebsiella pneumoniae]HBX5337524.1 hypothetical protein [Klebsiella pneumoniae]HDE1855937.1 hypothetical protein [Klebsiella pneumoniae]HDG5190377.1 hypothetical protein [Klebsiella pneumoniae]
MNIFKWLLTKHTPKRTVNEEIDTMALNVTMTAADVAKIVNDNAEIQAAVIAKYFEANAPSLVISDLSTTTSTTTSTEATTEAAA